MNQSAKLLQIPPLKIRQLSLNFAVRWCEVANIPSPVQLTTYVLSQPLSEHETYSFSKTVVFEKHFPFPCDSTYLCMPKPEIFITFRFTDEEKELLKQYCDQESRTQTDVLRELIRGLRRRP